MAKTFMFYPVGLEDTFTFGKHKGSTVESVILEEPSYIEWCFENVERFALNPEATKLYDLQEWEDDSWMEDREWDNPNS